MYYVLSGSTPNHQGRQVDDFTRSSTTLLAGGKIVNTRAGFAEGVIVKVGQ